MKLGSMAVTELSNAVSGTYCWRFPLNHIVCISAVTHSLPAPPALPHSFVLPICHLNDLSILSAIYYD